MQAARLGAAVSELLRLRLRTSLPQAALAASDRARRSHDQHASSTNPLSSSLLRWDFGKPAYSTKAGVGGQVPRFGAAAKPVAEVVQTAAIQSAAGAAKSGLGQAKAAAPEAAQGVLSLDYHVEIHTGDVRGGGTSADVFVNILGEHDVTGPRLLHSQDLDGDAEEFRSGSVKAFEVSVPENLGRISGLELKLGDDKVQAGHGWFVDRVVVRSPTGKEWEFPCKCWFGESECGGFEGPFERRLEPFVEPQSLAIKQFGSRLPRPLDVKCGTFIAPATAKVKKGTKAVSQKSFGYGGEDAYFKCHARVGANGEETFAMGVADGVYMWQADGIDAGQYSRDLMLAAKQQVEKGQCAFVTDVVETAAEIVERHETLGSCTFCVTLIDLGRGTLQNANLGDSGLIVLGGFGSSLSVKFKTPQQEHKFGIPYQLGHHDGADKAHAAMQSVVQVGRGDVVITGTDGLFDNVSEREIVDVTREMKEAAARRGASSVREAPLAGPAAHRLAHTIAHELGKRALLNSVSKQIETPYSKAATEAMDMAFRGGKQDDITVVAGVVH